jgi:hypothetical protein
MKVKHGFSTSSEKGSESESERGGQRERRARGRRGCESLREVGGVRGRDYERERDTHFQTRQPLYIYLYLIKPNFALLKRRENAYTENGEGRGRGKEGSSLTAFLFVMYSSASLMTTFLASADR